MKKRLLTVSAIFLISLSVMPSTLADSVDEMESRKSELQNQSSSISEEISEKDHQIQILEQDIVALEQEISKMQDEISHLVNKLEEQEQTLIETQKEIERLKSEIVVLERIIHERNATLESQARIVQTKVNPQEILSILLESESITDFYNRANVLTTIMSANRSIIHEQKEDQDALESKRQKAEVDYQYSLDLKQDIEILKNNLIAQKSELDDKMNQIMMTVSMTESEKSQLEAKQQEINQQTNVLSAEIEAERARQEEIKRQEEEARQRAIAEAEAKKDYVQVSSNSSFIMPASGVFSSYFGARAYPFGGYDFHLGLDIAGSGTVSAAYGGTVERAGYNSSYGYNVIINHGMLNGVEVKTLYAHMQPGLSVAPGMTVSQGQTLGIMGTTGDSTGVHLHFEVRENGQHVDPLGYL